MVNTGARYGPILTSTEIRTENFVLRRPRSSDLDAVAAACQDPEIPRFIPFVPVPYSIGDAQGWLEKVDSEWMESDERTFAIIDETRSEPFLGVVTVGLRDGGTVGYWLAPWARGRGVMTECVSAVVGWARDEQGVQRLFLTTHPDNVASQRVAERAGFVRVGMTDQHDPPFRDESTAAVLFELRGHS